jgi:glucose/arabinose dehydrogenase
MKLNTRILYIGSALLVIGLLVMLGTGQLRKLFFRPTGSTVERGVESSGAAREITTIAQNLNVPWGLAFLPDDDLLVTERPGILQRIGKNQQRYTIQGVTQTSEGGLLGVALDPEFEENNRVYLYMTTQNNEGITNQIERYVLKNDQLSNRKVLLEGIPGSTNHDGGRIAFGPDRLLYVTTGDAGNPELAQDTNSLAGKILRLTTEGSPASGNPFGNEVYSYGHRNPQGLAWDSNGRLWSTEHGRSGVASGYDELNLIKAGGNYGWPEIEGDESRDGMEKPVAHSGADETWAPASLAYANSSLYFAGLRGQSLYEAKINADNTVVLRAHFSQEYGRLRTVVEHGGSLYLTTSNTDGRGSPRPNDDKIFRIPLAVFE